MHLNVAIRKYRLGIAERKCMLVFVLLELGFKAVGNVERLAIGFI